MHEPPTVPLDTWVRIEAENAAYLDTVSGISTAADPSASGAAYVAGFAPPPNDGVSFIGTLIRFDWIASEPGYVWVRFRGGLSGPVAQPTTPGNTANAILHVWRSNPADGGGWALPNLTGWQESGPIGPFVIAHAGGPYNTYVSGGDYSTFARLDWIEIAVTLTTTPPA